VEVVAAAPRRGEVFLVALDPALGKEIRKARPCVVVSPNELNGHLSTVIVAPLTTGGHRYPFRIPCRFKKRPGFVVLDQLRTVDSKRLVRRLGKLSRQSLSHALVVLQEMFAA
jgi:mRNA interferase MazF